MIKWAPYMETGFAMIDEHHQELLRRINLLTGAVTERRNRRTVLETLDYLSAYVDFHFKAEEAIMTSLEYPRLEAHRGEHESFRRSLELLQSDFQEFKSGPNLTLEVQRFLADWWHHHILTTDRGLGRFAQLKQAA
jgi:hemerythrin